MKTVESSLVSLIDSLQASLQSLKGDLGKELTAALHDNSRLPDKRLAGLAAKAIDLLHETEQLLEPGPLVLADHFLGYADSKCLSAAVEYNIPDLLREGPKTIDELAVASGTRPDRLRQVMQVLSNKNIFVLDSTNHTCSNNRVSELLLTDHWTQWRNWVELYGSAFYDMARGIPEACRKDATRSPAQINFDTDKSMFAYFTDQGWNLRLHKTLGGGAVAQAAGLVEDYPWDSLKECSFLDIGGGAGAFVASILRKFPSMQGGVLDTADVIPQAQTNFHSGDGQFADVGSQVPASYLIVGDFMTEVPAFEIYTMKWCLHDWDDSKALKIMRNIRKAIKKGPNSRLIIFESILADGRSSRLSRYADLNMWIAVNGQERTEAQWRHLAEQTGWEVQAVHQLRNAWPCAIELHPVWRDEEQPQTKANGITPTEPVQPNASQGYGAPSMETNQVSSNMTFIEPWDNKKGYPFYRSAAAPGFESVNFKWVDNDIMVSNARPIRDDFQLDRNGFTYLDDADGLTTELLDALRKGDKETVQSMYYPRVEALVKKETGASRVIIFDHTLRKRDPKRDKTENATGKEQPATTVHCDQSGKGALRRLKQNLTEDDDYDTILKGRVQMLNVWRPLNGTVVDWPLAQMDFTTLNPDHVHPCDLWRGEYEERGQTVTIEHAPGQRWWHLGGHRTDEVTLLKIWDSWGHKGVADVCPHAAFKHPDTPADAPPRESVEVRCLVLHDAIAE